MRILILFYLIMLLSNCATVEVAKEVSKATKSISASVNNMMQNSTQDQKSEIIEQNSNEIINEQLTSLEKEKENKEKIIKEQKSKTKINFLGKNSKEIKLMVGEPKLIRIDGNTKTERFDNAFCQLFLLSNAQIINSEVEYFEIRNKQGKLIINRDRIEKCYKNFKLI